jgi:Polyketide cyclase / dehydrase and lipid transport
MNSVGSIEIGAPAPVVWGVFSDVERWPGFTASVKRIVALDGAGLAVGKRFEISQPRLPRLVWEVTELEAGSSWTWIQRSLGSETVARHQVTALGPELTIVRQQLEQSGPLGALVGWLMRGTTRRYLDLEARGLKAASEYEHRDAASA